MLGGAFWKAGLKLEGQKSVLTSPCYTNFYWKAIVNTDVCFFMKIVLTSR